MSDILLAEYTLKRALREHTMDLVQTSSPHLFCTPLPKHWRSNKSLPNQFRVVSLLNIPDGTRVSVSAGNEDRPFAELKNPITVMHGNEARFSDLRFLGRSGRGKSFNITITIETTPPLVAVYARAIKVTVDGPRVPRNKYSAPRTMKMMKEHRRLGARHSNSFEQNRFCRGSTARGISYLSDSIRTAMRRNLHNNNNNNNNTTTVMTKDSFSSYKDSKNIRIPFSTSAFRQTAQPCSPANALHRSGSPRDTTDSLPLSTLSNGFSAPEKSPSSSDHSVPSFTAKPETSVSFSPFESTYLLSSINEAYARLLSRHFQPQPPPQSPLAAATAVASSTQQQQQQIANNSHVMMNRSFPSSKMNCDINSTNPFGPQDLHTSCEYSTSYASRTSKEETDFKPIDQFRFNCCTFQRPLSQNRSEVFTQSRRTTAATVSAISQSSVKPASDSTPMTVIHGNRLGQMNGSDHRTLSFSSLNPFAQQLSSSACSLSATSLQTPIGSFPQAFSGLQTTSTVLTPGPTQSVLNPYESSFYGILGAMFANWIQRSADRKGVSYRQTNPATHTPIPFGVGAFRNQTPDEDSAMDVVGPINLAARSEDPDRRVAGCGETVKSVESNESTIMSIERLLAHSSSRTKEVRTDETRGFQIPNQFRYPTHPLNVSDLTLLSNAFTKHFKDQSFRT